MRLDCDTHILKDLQKQIHDTGSEFVNGIMDISEILSLSDKVSWLYSERAWAVGIVQLTHHEVRGGAKNPETMSFCFYLTLYMCKIFISLEA